MPPSGITARDFVRSRVVPINGVLSERKLPGFSNSCPSRNESRLRRDCMIKEDDPADRRD